MENVTLNQKEQARLQILNSLLSEHMTVDQAAILMGVSMRHTRRILAAYREEGAAALAHGHRGRTGSQHNTRHLRSPKCRASSSNHGTQGVNHTHLSELLREREGMDIARNTSATHTGGSRSSQSSSPTSTEAPCSSTTYAPRGDADTDRWQLSSVARRGRTSIHASACRGRRHGQSGQCAVL